VQFGNKISDRPTYDFRVSKYDFRVFEPERLVPPAQGEALGIVTFSGFDPERVVH
jgi:hypothetical protein